jgi:DNA polymerase-3 subunit alpha
LNFVPLHCHSHYSLLDGLSKPAQIANRCVEIGTNACAISDHGTLAGCVAFMKALKDVCKCGHQKAIHNTGKKCNIKGCNCVAFTKYEIKPILGCEFYLSPQPATVKDKTNRKLSHLVILAKNLQGWKSLIQATSEANKKEHIYYDKPRLDLVTLASFARGNIITFSGHMGSDMANIVFDNPKLAYAAKTYEEARLLVRSDWKEKTIQLAGKYVELFGKENFSLEIQIIDSKSLPASLVVAKILRYVGKLMGIPCTATADSHFPRPEDAADQRILLCSSLETTLGAVERKIENQEEVGLGAFFKSNRYHIPDNDEIYAVGHTEEELNDTLRIAEMCESYDILGKPSVPSFPCPDGKTSDAYLKELCAAGWQKKISTKIPKAEQGVYAERVKYELDVIQNAKILSDYFLIVHDYVSWAKQRMMVGKGRGSGAGCLVSHLLDITDIDPIKYGLIFERFYNAGRNTPERTALPDIDSDFPKQGRESVIEYMRNKHGKDKVAQMITFQRLQGRGAMTDVLRAHEACSFSEIKNITEHIPDEAEISDELQLMKEATGEASIIRWALENNAKELKQWCFIDDDGNLQGDFAKLFEQAIRIEGTKSHKSKHASGIVISTLCLSEVCPMVYDKKTEQLIAGLEMNDLEAMGIPKFDILGVAILDKIMGVQSLLRTGKI